MRSALEEDVAMIRKMLEGRGLKFLQRFGREKLLYMKYGTRLLFMTSFEQSDSGTS